MMKTTDEEVVACKYEAVTVMIDLLTELRAKKVPIVDVNTNYERYTDAKSVRIEVLYMQDEQSDAYTQTREAVVRLVPFPYWHVHEEDGHLAIYIDYPIRDCQGCAFFQACKI